MGAGGAQTIWGDEIKGFRPPGDDSVMRAADSCWVDSLFERLPDKLSDTMSKVIQ